MSAQADQEIPVSFATFVVSLAQSAMMHLGETANPVTGASDKNLPLARNTIDLLGLLQTKTKGNLEVDEAKLLESVLFELRTKYTAAKA